MTEHHGVIDDQVWCAPLKKRKKGKKGPGAKVPGSASTLPEPLGQQLPQACQALSQSLQVMAQSGNIWRAPRCSYLLCSQHPTLDPMHSLTSPFHFFLVRP